jgi:hypothetical protein
MAEPMSVMNLLPKRELIEEIAQIMGIALALLIVGGLASLMVIFNPDDAHRAAFPFACFFAGFMAFALAIIGGLVYTYVSEPIGGVITMLMAPTVGLFGGGVFGHRLGQRPREKRAVA